MIRNKRGPTQPPVESMADLWSAHEADIVASFVLWISSATNAISQQK